MFAGMLTTTTANVNDNNHDNIFATSLKTTLFFLYVFDCSCGDRSKGPCKEFELRRPFMLCWEPSRKFFCEFATDFFIRESFAKVGDDE